MPICEECELEMLTAEQIIKIKEYCDKIENNINKIHQISKLNEEVISEFKYVIRKMLEQTKHKLQKIKTVSEYNELFNEYGSFKMRYDLDTIEELINKLI